MYFWCLTASYFKLKLRPHKSQILRLADADGLCLGWWCNLHGYVFVTVRTNPNAATSGNTRGTVSKPTGGGRRGTRFRCRMCSIHVRTSKTRGRFRGGTSHTAGTGCGGRWIEALLFFKLAIRDDGRSGGVIREGTHAPPLCLSSRARVKKLPLQLKALTSCATRYRLHIRVWGAKPLEIRTTCQNLVALR
jgi:hypothetical protein